MMMQPTSEQAFGFFLYFIMPVTTCSNQCFRSVHWCRIGVAGVPTKMAVRAGCVVISFGLREDGAAPLECSQKISHMIEEEVQAWMREDLGLFDGNDDADAAQGSVSLQVCLSVSVA